MAGKGPRRVLFYDVETSPSLAFVWSARTEYVGKQMMEDLQPPVLFTWAAKWRGEDRVMSRRLTRRQAIEQDDQKIVSDLGDLMRRADVVVGHNIDRFDTRVMRTRLLMGGLEPIPLVDTIDTLSWSKKHFRFPYNDLGYLGEQMVGDGKMNHVGFDLWRRSYRGDVDALKTMQAYNEQDVRLNERVFDAMLKHVPRAPRLFIAEGEQCVYCGSEDLAVRGYRTTGVHEYPRWHCKDCKRYFRGRNSVNRNGYGRRPAFAPL